MQPPRLLRTTASFLLVAGVVPAALLAYAPTPFIWIFLLWALAFFLQAFRHRAARGPRLLLLLAAISFSLFVAEAALTHLRHETTFRGTAGPEYMRSDALLGFEPNPGARAEVERHEHGELLYHVTYSIGPDGWRLTPAPETQPADGAVLCLGGSYTFGDGLEDEETYPWVLARASGRRFRVHNISCPGWGAHHLLALLEAGRIDAALEEPPLHAIYLAIPHHVRRAVGLTAWGRSAPRYVRDDYGQVVRKGTFLDQDQEAAAGLGGWIARGRFELLKSRLARRLMPRSSPSSDDLAFYLDIVDAAARRLRADHPECRFHVLVWDDAREDAGPLVAGLSDRGHPVYRVSSFLEDLDQPPSRWHNGRWDGHPSAAAAAEIATWAVEKLLQDGPPGGASQD